MDNVNDDALRKYFQKLSSYETQHKGISWEELETELPVSKKYYWREAVTAAALVMLIGGTVWYFSKREATTERTQALETAATTTLSESTTVPTLLEEASNTLPSFSSETQPSQLSDDSFSKTQLHQNNTAEAILEQHNTEALNFAPSANDQEKAEIHTEPQQLTADTVVENTDDNYPEKDQPKKLDLRWWGEAAYMFGIVQPNSRDAFVIDNFQFKPGMALRLGFDFKALTTSSISLSVGSYYQLARKSFQFDVMQFDEETRLYQIKDGATTHQLGAVLRLAPREKSWDVALAVGRNFRSDSFLLGSTVSVSATKSVLPVGKNGMLTISASATAPLGDFKYFKYYPLQVAVGLAQIR